MNITKLAKLHTDGERFSFLERNDISVSDSSYFTILTQHINKKDVMGLRGFVDTGIEFQNMLDANGIGSNYWHFLYFHHDIYLKAWVNEHRPINEVEKEKIKKDNEEYVEVIRKSLEEKESVGKEITDEHINRKTIKKSKFIAP